MGKKPRLQGNAWYIIPNQFKDLEKSEVYIASHKAKVGKLHSEYIVSSEDG